MKSIYAIFALVIVAGCSPSTSSATCDEDESRCPVAKFYCASTPCNEPCVASWTCACPPDNEGCSIKEMDVCVPTSIVQIDDGDPCTRDTCDELGVHHEYVCGD